MTKQDLIFAIDQGGQSSRVAVYSGDGVQLCCFAAPCATNHRLLDGLEHIEQDPQEILQGIHRCIAQIQQTLGDAVKKITCAGFAGQGSSLLAWNNQTGEALTPVISWQDIRGEQYVKHIPYSHQQIQTLTGLRLSPHYGASKIRWCLDHSEKVIAAQKNNCLSIGPIVSYIFWHLLRANSSTKAETPANSDRSAWSLGIDPGHAQRTLLWNLQTNDWDQPLLDLFGLSRAILPQCRYHNSHFGNLLLGEHSIPFTTSARDQGASLFARGQPDKSACYINIGTGAFIQRVSENLSAPEGLLISPLWLPEGQPRNNPGIELASSPCYLPELLGELQSQPLYAWEATVNGAAAATTFIAQQTGLSVTPEEINRALAGEPSQECYFLNAIGGLSAPYWRTDLQSRFSESLTAQEKIIAWIESVVFQIMVNLQLMAKAGRTQKIYLSGGLSNADAVCQKIADLAQARVIRNQNADATLQGIAYMATGLNAPWSSQAADSQFQPAVNPPLAARFERWQLAMGDWLK